MIYYILLGIIQGLTEFLPVSSSGHIVLLGNLLGIGTDMMMLTVILHLGTLCSVIFIFRKKIIDMIKHPFTHYNYKIIISTIITLICYLLFSDIIDSAFSGDYLVYGFLFTAFVLLISDMIPYRCRHISYKGSAAIGIAQSLALFPAVSRSGMTIATGVLLGYDRLEVTEYSFLLSIPAILGSGINEAMHITSIDTSQILSLIMAFIFAAISGVFAIKYMLKLVQKSRMYIFSIYLILLSIIIMIV